MKSCHVVAIAFVVAAFLLSRSPAQDMQASNAEVAELKRGPVQSAVGHAI